MSIQKISVLESLVGLDQNNHELKAMAINLITAMNDWPDDRKMSIDDFVQDFKAYFGNPLSVSSIETIQFDGQNAWQLESGKQIAALLKRAQKFIKTEDLDLAISRILKFYGQEYEKVDFVAELKMLPTIQGGVKSFVPNGYKPQLRFNGHNISVMCELTFENKEVLYAGEKTKVKVKLAESRAYGRILTSGMPFEISNVSSVVGIGEIQQVVNVDLKKENWMESFAKNSIFAMI